ncbi:hypothetical protein J3R30DRAFT_3731979 [Lentinula aciculospora]|uniref:MYND-type domain-containing protein n=1 Tax=Lentinula aciculospora TaxID=153920 RepID=A0A9W9AJ88_9AGAR|nr:hypothetical protein J3R30DRAFT_3731979 [Lentinula aciculospora]
MPAGLPSLRDTRFFPLLFDLPHDYFFAASEQTYYDLSMDRTRGCTIQPNRHWCFLAEIVEVVPRLTRPTYRAKDISGTTLVISFRFDDRALFPKVLKKGLAGSTICVMYANFHHFMDGHIGITLKEPKNVKIVPLGLDGLVMASEIVRAGNSTPDLCVFCQKPASKRCSSCSAISYCSKTCQTRAWKVNHKKECTVIQQMKTWSEFDWEKYDAHKGFIDFP